MLHWLAGQKQPEAASYDSDQAEPPETPAPVFAVRAFKHAIFGTPATVDVRRQRRNSNLERDCRPATKPTRPVLTRPKSASDATLWTQSDEIPPSPTKGILLTPGTIGGRGKSVTFGGPIKESRDGANERGSLSPERSSKTRSSKGHGSGTQHSADALEHMEQSIEDLPKDVVEHEPECAVGRYWKREYDIYRENTTRELRKLITKQKAAKGYAREKDTQCSALTDELQKERIKVDRLEQRAKELEAQLRALQAEIANESGGRAIAATTVVPATATSQGQALPSRVPHAQGTKAPDVRQLDNSALDRHNIPAIEPSSPIAGTPSIPRGQAHRQHNTKPFHDTSTSEADLAAIMNAPEITSIHTISRPATGARSSTFNGQHVEAKQRPNPRVRHDSFEPDACMPASSLKWPSGKENTAPTVSIASPIAHAQSPLEENKTIVSREGEVIPPDRVAAARARLAARRQLRAAS